MKSLVFEIYKKQTFERRYNNSHLNNFINSLSWLFTTLLITIVHKV